MRRVRPTLKQEANTEYSEVRSQNTEPPCANKRTRTTELPSPLAPLPLGEGLGEGIRAVV